MRELAVAHYVNPTRFGGQEQFLGRLLRSLPPLGVRAVAVFGGRGEVVTRFRGAGVESHVVPLSDFRRGYAGLRRLLERERFDLVQTNMYSPLAAMLAGDLGRPHIWRVGGHPDLTLRRIRRADRAGLLASISALSAAVVCNSAYVMDALRAVRPSRLHLIHNGVPLASWAGPRRRCGAPRIGMLGHYDAQKRHVDLIRAADRVRARFPGATFHLLGGDFADAGMRRYRDRLRAEIRARGLGSAVTMTRRVHDVFAALRTFDVAVLPSTRESSSNALLEAMVVGTPVVAADHGGHREIIRDGVDGLLHAPERPGALADCIVHILDDADLARRLSSRARARVARQFSMERSALAYRALYHRLAGRRSPPT